MDKAWLAAICVLAPRVFGAGAPPPSIGWPPECDRISRSKILTVSVEELRGAGFGLIALDRERLLETEEVISRFMHCIEIQEDTPDERRGAERSKAPGVPAPADQGIEAVCIRGAIDRLNAIMERDAGVILIAVDRPLNLVLRRIARPTGDGLSLPRIFWRRTQESSLASSSDCHPVATYANCSLESSELVACRELSGRTVRVRILRGGGDQPGVSDDGVWESIDGGSIVKIYTEREPDQPVCPVLEEK